MLARCELRKLFAGRMRWILLLVFFLNFLLYYLYLIPYTPVEKEQELYESLVKKTGDRKTLEAELAKIDAEFQKRQEERREKYEAGDFDYVPDQEQQTEELVLGKLKEQYQEVLDFYDFTEQVEERSQKLLEFSIFSKEDGFSQRNIEKTSRDFAKLEGVEAVPVDGTGLLRVQDFFLTDLFAILAVCLFAFQSFGKEGRSGMQKLLNTTLYGRGRLRLRQLAVLSLCTAVYMLLLYGSNLWQTGTFLGFPDLGAEIHGIREFRNIPFPCTVGEYLIFSLVWKVAAALAVSFLFYAVVYKLNGANGAWLLLGGGTVVSFLLWFYLPPSPVIKIFRYLNVIGIFDTGEILGNYQNLNLFSYPVELRITAGAVLLLSVLAGGTVVVLGHPSQLTLRFGTGKELLPSRYKKGIFFNECYKNLGLQKGWILLLLLLAYTVHTGRTTAAQEEYLSAEDYAYEQLAKDFTGRGGEDLEQMLAGLSEREEFTDSAEAKAARKILGQGRSVLDCGSEDARFVSERSWSKIFFDQQTELKNFGIFLICTTLSASGLFYLEEKSRMRQLLCSAAGRKSVYWSKFGVICGESVLYAAILWLGTYSSLLKKYEDLEGGGWSSYSIPAFQDFPVEISILGMLVLFFLQRLISALLMGILLFLLAQVLVTPAYLTGAVGLGFFLPAMVLLIADLDYFNPLVTLLSYHVKPFLGYVPVFSSGLSVYWEYPVFLYPVLYGAGALCLWYGMRRWIKK